MDKRDGLREPQRPLVHTCSADMDYETRGPLGIAMVFSFSGFA